ncbi:hypothetical protein BGL34_03895 [Fructilactobacillus lindneri]|uniref:Type II toxin-antitoxin system PemK/MazF family toxin n=1 Tax=Fructilactobacillus lindneri DSM 20690 = JCM 11027 TaxID=1122148 RepID=A0A0R2JNY6_9LACO|nr:type II toxin-antitoxin system PemK/MazF family toxin [Fructilactobacillus lindneri]KRN78824.1 hypothetical protein IV52_GL001104 [Fructilactobacillus lindneri DSM 20690 = JCM 11027]POG98033.1 hypothetical protein BGL31_04860 [Fructilactobacillus lindneri]POG99070.1 hypothetical protein BGL32_05925 [Fructilactobacillus lindneri]POH03670.1 hypothetical protein BGL33_03345 [Fructilactobacillus lindneri]POH06373.1 hypothetical protein BGL35_03165 [Fructilactobacillus lindneri]
MSGINRPKQGDIIFIDAEPHSGHEYGGHNEINKNIRRPFLVLSGNYYNLGTGMIAGFPITHKEPKFSPSIKINTPKIKGYAVAQILGYDFFARNGTISETLDKKSS